MVGITLVNLAFILYTLFFILKRKQNTLTAGSLIILSLAVLIDFCATALMIMGSTTIGLTFHGSIGYLALLGMTVELVLLWLHRMGENRDNPLPLALIRYTGIAYYWWLFVYVFGIVRILV